MFEPMPYYVMLPSGTQVWIAQVEAAIRARQGLSPSHTVEPELLSIRMAQLQAWQDIALRRVSLCVRRATYERLLANMGLHPESHEPDPVELFFWIVLVNPKAEHEGMMN